MISPTKILILEDYPSDAELINLELREADINFVSTRIETENDFLTALESFSPDIILADYKMPQWTAIDALKSLKEKNYNIPLILVTGNQTEEIAVESMKQGAFDYIIKDNLKRLPNAVANALKNREIEQAKFEAEEALITEYSFRKTIEETMLAGVQVIDINLSQTYVNAAFCQMVGWSREELIGMTPPYLYWPMDKKEELMDHVFALIEEMNLSFQFETKYLKKNGEHFYVQVLSSAMKDCKGNITGWVLVVHDITEQRLKEEQIKSSLIEKEILLKEVHHRVKNNMQIVSSLLSLQAGYLNNDKLQEVFNESRNRIKALALIHEYLYKSKELTKIDFANYINDLIQNLFVSYRVDLNNYKLITSFDDIGFDIDTSINLGIIINELVSNSIKYAFNPRTDSENIIRIVLKAENNTINMIISDNGKGLDDNINFNDSDSLGLQLVKTLVDQLEGSLDIKSDNGLQYRIVFNYRLTKNSVYQEYSI
ncbi:MAG: histidine kinase dimerization/phosphoacceptor domain -containing protein [Ignavibacteriaceae bacterium]